MAFGAAVLTPSPPSPPIAGSVGGGENAVREIQKSPPPKPLGIEYTYLKPLEGTFVPPTSACCGGLSRMKREVTRERTIAAFSIGLAELEALWARLSVLFEGEEVRYTSIDIALPNEKLDFNSVQELREFSTLRGAVYDFSITLSSRTRRINIRPLGFFRKRIIVKATGESEAWCAGAIEIVYTFLRSHRVWYYWFLSVPIGWVLFALVNFPAIASLLRLRGTEVNAIVYSAWLISLIALAIPYFFGNRLLPAASLRITSEESFVRRYSGELNLVIALLALVLALVSFFLGK